MGWEVACVQSIKGERHLRMSAPHMMMLPTLNGVKSLNNLNEKGPLDLPGH